MISVLAVVNLALIAWLSLRGWKKSGQGDTSVYWSSLLFRLVCGLAVGLTYKYYYHNSGDTFTFFSDAANLAQFAYQEPGAWLSFLVTGDSPVPLVTTEPRSVVFVGILSVVNVATANNYWISSLWFSLFSFWCAYRLVRKIDAEFTQLGFAARIAFLFVPSVVFWSSGVVKESLAVAAIAILVIHFLSIIRDQRLKWHAYAEIIVSLYRGKSEVLLGSRASSVDGDQPDSSLGISEASTRSVGHGGGVAGSIRALVCASQFHTSQLLPQ